MRLRYKDLKIINNLLRSDLDLKISNLARKNYLFSVATFIFLFSTFNFIKVLYLFIYYKFIYFLKHLSFKVIFFNNYSLYQFYSKRKLLLHFNTVYILNTTHIESNLNNVFALNDLRFFQFLFLINNI